MQVGDIVEIKVDGKFAYAQFVGTAGTADWVVMQIWPDLFPQPLRTFRNLSNPKRSYRCFWQIKPDLDSRRLIRVVANEPVSPRRQQQPFKTRLTRNWIFTGRVEQWGISSRQGTSVQAKSKLTRKEKELPIYELVNAEEVIYRLKSHWRPELACIPDNNQGLPGIPCAPDLTRDPQRKETRSSRSQVDLFKGDAVWDALGEIEQQGIRVVRETIDELWQSKDQDDLEREPAYFVIAAAAAILARHQVRFPELEQNETFPAAVAKLPAKISSRLVGRLVELLAKIRISSEPQWVYAELGLEREWRREIASLIRRLKQLGELQ